MYAVLGGLILVPAIDQAIKMAVRRLLGDRTIPFGLGEIRVASAAPPAGEQLATLWATWMIVAVPVAAVCAIVTPMSWPGGLVLGASLSNLVELSRRRTVCNYICIRGRSPFNLADVVIRVAGVILAFGFSRALYTSW
jgi:lipoprotein signal peptidase